jgi:hypothetical protein
MANTKTKTKIKKTKTQTVSEKVSRIDDYLCDLWNDVEEGILSPVQTADRIEKTIKLLDDLRDSL